MKIKYSIQKLNNGDSNYSIFLSHSNADDSWHEIEEVLKLNDINVVSDVEIEPGNPDFSQCIKNMIKNNEIVVSIIHNKKLTSWMVYELGIAAGLGKKIIMYSKEYVDENDNHLFGQYGPVITDLKVLVHEIKNGFFFADLFQYETNNLSKKHFLADCMTNINICKLSFKIPGIEDIPRQVYKFGYILLSVSRYEKMGNNNRSTDICNMTAEEIIDCKCNIDNEICSLYSKQVFNSPTDVILNKILYNCNVDLFNQTIYFAIPYNAKRGVTFKCFVDVENMDYVQNIMTTLEKAGLQDIGVSHSVLGNRIYFILPQSVMQGLFIVEAPDGFINNYLCKGAIL